MCKFWQRKSKDILSFERLLYKYFSFTERNMFLPHIMLRLIFFLVDHVSMSQWMLLFFLFIIFLEKRPQKCPEICRFFSVLWTLSNAITGIGRGRPTDHTVKIRYVEKWKSSISGGSLTFILHSKIQTFKTGIGEGLQGYAIFFPFWCTFLAMTGLEVL